MSGDSAKRPDRKLLRLRTAAPPPLPGGHGDDAETPPGVANTRVAAYSHPLMPGGGSPPSPDYPDVIPERSRRPAPPFFKPQAHSSALALPGPDPAPDKGIVSHLSLVADPGPPSPASDAEADERSVYEAHVAPDLRNVSLTMTEREGSLNFVMHGRRSAKLRRIRVVQPEAAADSDVSSLESDSDSLRSEDCFGAAREGPDGDGRSEIVEGGGSPAVEPIEPLSAAEERRDARRWQRTVLPDGQRRTIDMRVIEPYKRVLSHGGYVRAGGRTAIVVFAACFLPDRSRVDYDYVMDNLFLYALWTLERLVTDEYVLVYLHGAAARLPAFAWLRRCYRMVGRRLRKDLARLHVVHPTLWVRTALFMARPFISAKFYRKITFSASLKELAARLPLEMAAVPEKVKAYDSLHCTI